MEEEDSSSFAFCLEVWTSPLILHTACMLVHSYAPFWSERSQLIQLTCSPENFAQVISHRRNLCDRDHTRFDSCIAVQSSVPRVTAGFAPSISTFPDIVWPQPVQHFCRWDMKIPYYSELGTFNSNRQTSKQINKRLLGLKGSEEMPDSPYTVQPWPTCCTEPSLETHGHKPLGTTVVAARDHLLLKDCFIRRLKGQWKWEDQFFFLGSLVLNEYYPKHVTEAWQNRDLNSGAVSSNVMKQRRLAMPC